jgi:predicted ATPase
MKRREPAPFAPSQSERAPAEHSASGVRESLVRTNVGRAGTSFVGRRRELSELRTLLAESPVVTIQGPPGIGKTRLACELATMLTDEFAREGGVWRIDLDEAKDADRLYAAMGRTLRVGTASMGRTPAAALGAALAARGRTLLLLDGMANGALLARALSEWVLMAPNVAWLVTSPTRLGVEREAALDLGPIATSAVGGALAPAAVLFAHRAGVSQPEGRLDGKTAAEVVSLVVRLEGIPLAIELAAARVDLGLERTAGERGASATPTEMLEQGWGRAVPEARHGVLRSAISAAWTLLGPCEKDALAQASVFQGGFDLEAAERVLDLRAYPAAPPVGEVLDRLCAASLLTASPSYSAPRFATHASIRDFARQRLAELGGRESAVLRHARNYANAGRAQAERFDVGDRARDAAAWLTAESENLLAAHGRMTALGRAGAEVALDAALGLDPILAAFGPSTLRFGLLDPALVAAEDLAPQGEGADGAAPEGTSDPTRGDAERHAVDARILALEARADAHQGAARAKEAVADAQAALTLATTRGTRQTVGRALRGLANHVMLQGRRAEARRLLDNACALARVAKLYRDEGRSLGLLGTLDALEGKFDSSWSTLHHAIARHRETGDRRFEAIGVGQLALVAHETGRSSETRAFCADALELCRELGAARLEAELLGVLACLAHEGGSTDEARELYPRALALHYQVGNRRGEGVVLGRYGILLAELEDFEGARAAYGKGLSVLRECRDRQSEAMVLGALAALEAREDGLESARSVLNHATECVEASEAERPRAALSLWRGHLELALAREAYAEGDESRGAMLSAAASKRLDHAGAPKGGEGRGGVDVRLAYRALAQALRTAAPETSPAALSERPAGPASKPRYHRQDGGSAPAPSLGPPPDAPADALIVCAHGRWFRAPRGEVVSVARWRPLQRILERLAERREIAPGEPLGVETLVAAGWPGERVLPKAGATRVYTAIASLRRLGLKDMLTRDERGYLLRAEVGILRISGR